MAQYIDKSALVAEIEKLIANGKEKCQQSKENNAPGSYIAWSEHIATCGKILSYINTIEVKENDLLTEEETEKELAEYYINLFDKKFGDKLPNLKGKHLAEFKNFINTCEQIFHLKYFDYHATQGKLFEKLALLWAAWGKEHLSLKVKEVDLEKETKKWWKERLHLNPENQLWMDSHQSVVFAKHFFELGLNAQRNINIDITNIDKVIEENGVDPNSKEAKIFKESYYIALEKLKARKGE